MCWYTFNKRFTVKHKASKDITVYKAVRPDLRSIHTNFQYTFHEECPYITLSLLIKPFPGLDSTYDCYSIYKGYHSYESYDLAIRAFKDNELKDFVVLECTIPRNTGYYVDEDGIIVSETIIPERVIN